MMNFDIFCSITFTDRRISAAKAQYLNSKKFAFSSDINSKLFVRAKMGIVFKNSTVRHCMIEA